MRLFGTDGVRGLANGKITGELALGLGVAAALELGVTSAPEGERPRAIIGRDTRISGQFLTAALTAGMASAGVDVIDVGVLPTPAVAYLTGAMGVDFGVMISASHNPMEDNGIKFLARGGLKLDDAVEDRIEARLTAPWERPTGPAVGRIVEDSGSADDDYVEHLIASIGAQGNLRGRAKPLAGLRIAVDCANGAASDVGPRALRAAGADVVVMNASPDGRNINSKCGSNHPEQLQAVTVASEADFGVAFDGDADRCIAVDHQGNIVDGDQIMGVLALAMKERGALKDDTLVLTVMSNLGLILAMRDAGIQTVQTAVGDRYVLEEIRANGYSLGGEQSGHIIMSEFATTGDGILSALHLAAQVQQAGARLADMVKAVPRLPQTLINVAGVNKSRASVDHGVVTAVADAERELGETGRVVLRPSGTEQLVRVMVEAATQEQADQVATALSHVVRDRLAL